MTGVLVRRGNLDKETYKEDNVKARRGPSASQGERPETDPSLTALRRNQPETQTSGFSRAVRK